MAYNIANNTQENNSVVDDKKNFITETADHEIHGTIVFKKSTKIEGNLEADKFYGDGSELSNLPTYPIKEFSNVKHSGLLYSTSDEGISSSEHVYLDGGVLHITEVSMINKLDTSNLKTGRGLTSAGILEVVVRDGDPVSIDSSGVHLNVKKLSAMGSVEIEGVDKFLIHDSSENKYRSLSFNELTRHIKNSFTTKASGANGTIQINDGGDLSSNSDFYFDSRNSRLHIPNIICDGVMEAGSIVGDGSRITNLKTYSCDQYSNLSNVRIFSNSDLNYIDSSEQSVEVLLPLASTIPAGKRITILDSGGKSFTNNITIITREQETIDGKDSYVMQKDYGCITIVSDGNNKFFILSVK